MVTIEKVQMDLPGVLTLGDTLRIFMLGTATTIVAVTQDTWDQFRDDPEFVQMLREALGAEHLIWVKVKEPALAAFTPLEQSADLKALITDLIVEALNAR